MVSLNKCADSEWSTEVLMTKKGGTSDKRYAVDYRARL